VLREIDFVFQKFADLFLVYRPCGVYVLQHLVVVALRAGSSVRTSTRSSEGEFSLC